MRIALIGTGRWGANIERTLKSIKGVELVHTYGRPKKGSDYHSLLKNRDTDGVIIATPGSTHAEVALPFIEQGIPVFIEKPVATTLQDARRLQSAAERSGSTVFAGHLHLYNPAFLKAKELVKKSGNIKAIVCEGISSGPRRDDMSVLWDWGSHDVYLALDLMGMLPKAVQAWGSCTDGKLHDITITRLYFPKNIDAVIINSWLSPDKRKKVNVTCEKATVVFEDTAKKKLAVHKGETTLYPQYEKTVALERELKAFIRCIKTKQPALSSITDGADVVSVLAAADKSIRLGGKIVKL